MSQQDIGLEERDGKVQEGGHPKQRYVLRKSFVPGKDREICEEEYWHGQGY